MLGQLSQIGSEVDRVESGFDLATRVIQMFGEDIDSGVWCDLPSGGNSRWHLTRCQNYRTRYQQNESSGAASPKEQTMNFTTFLCDCWTDLVAAFYPSKRQGIRGPHRDYFFFPHLPSLVLFPRLRRYPPHVLGIRCSKPSPWLSLFGLTSIRLRLVLLNGACLRHQAARWIDHRVNCLYAEVYWVWDPYTHVYLTYTCIN